MGRIAIVFFLLVQANTVRSEITYDSREFRPQGKHYTVKENFLYYSLYPNAKTDQLTLLYFKTPSKAIIFKGFWMSKSLEEKLPMVVVKYIGKYITDLKLKEKHSIEDAIEVTKKAVDNALNQKWKKNLLDNAPKMVANLRYHRGYSIIDNNAYYEFTPSHLSARDSTKPDYIKSPASWAAGFQSGDIKKNVDNIVAALNSHKEHHDSKIVSDWPWKYSTASKSWLVTSDTTNYHEKEVDTCKLTMGLQTVDKGELMPSMCWRQINGASWTAPPTYCNFFAQTLAYLTFGKSGYDPNTSSKTSTGWYPWEVK